MKPASEMGSPGSATETAAHDDHGQSLGPDNVDSVDAALVSLRRDAPTSGHARSLDVPTAVWEGCLRRIRLWHIPPNWSAHDWYEESRAEAAAAAVQAAHDFDPTRGVLWGAFVRARIMAGALTRFRREWSYAARQISRKEQIHRSSDDRGGATNGEPLYRVLQETLNELPRDDRRLIESLFWGGATEAEVAGILGISQQAVNKRKRVVLNTLRAKIVQSISRDWL